MTIMGKNQPKASVRLNLFLLQKNILGDIQQADQSLSVMLGACLGIKGIVTQPLGMEAGLKSVFPIESNGGSIFCFFHSFQFHEAFSENLKKFVEMGNLTKIGVEQGAIPSVPGFWNGVPVSIRYRCRGYHEAVSAPG